MERSNAGAEELSPVKRALLEVRRLRAGLESLEKRQREPIAVIGIGLRLPRDVSSPDSFWRLLANGTEAVDDVPPERFEAVTGTSLGATRGESLGAEAGSARRGSYLRDVDQFDSHFFGIAPREADSIDPQQRLLLEVAWEALEHAGQPADMLFGSKAGVFLGVSNSDYLRLALGSVKSIDAYTAQGSLYSLAAGRLSHFLGLHGPSLVIDTACSSSLVAVHLAVQSLRRGECALALAGAVNLILSPEISLGFIKAKMLAPDGRCKAFDATADGYVRGEGCAVVVLKRLSEAIAAGDDVLAVIRGSAVNHDGRSASLTTPNGPAQTQVICDAVADAGVNPHEIGYVEAHGTGTSLGDPIEVHALVEALAQGRAPTNPLRLGSVKTNLGHLEAAAGLAGLIKVIMALQHGQIPPHLHLRTPNPGVTLDGAPVTIPTQLTDWESASGPRRAGVSAFGLSGTNAHVILEEAPERPAEARRIDRSPQVLCLSAKSPGALRELTQRYRDLLADLPADTRFGDVCSTASAGRSHFDHRVAIVAGTAQEASEVLAALAKQRRPADESSAVAPELAFLFSGDWASYPGMGRQLFDTEPTFRACLERCDELARPYLHVPLLSVLYPDRGTEVNGARSMLGESVYADVALYSLQCALVSLWRSWGVEPAMVLGHGVGEYAAAWAAGVFSLEDGMTLVAAASRILEATSLHGGPESRATYAVFAESSQVEAAVSRHTGSAVLAVNGPRNVVVSGEADAVEQVLQDLRAHNVRARRLAGSSAARLQFISETSRREFGQIASTVDFRSPRIGLVSGATGRLGLEDVTTPGYWGQVLCQPVQFQSAVSTLETHGLRIFVEIGPNPALVTLGRRCLKGDSRWLPSLRRGRDDSRQILECLATLYNCGVNVDWRGFHRGADRRRVSLPTYPFQRRRHWFANPPVASAGRPIDHQRVTCEAVRVAGASQAEQGPFDLAPETYPAKWAALERLSVAYIVRTLESLGGFSHAGESFAPEELVARFRILPLYVGLLRRWLGRLASAGLLEEMDGCFVASLPLKSDDLAPALDTARQILADSPMVLGYVERCGDNLAEVLTGRMGSLETLFPGGSSELAEGLYKHWAVSRYYAGLVRAALQSYVAALPADQPIRIVEVGAGTGATTAALLPVLPADRTSYYFTDVSDLFLGRASEEFDAYAFVRYGRLDIERDPVEQGYPAQSFDVVVAANVLHATANLHQAVEHVRQLLVPGGLLLLDEATEPLTWFDITTGLIEGWQRFEDDLRHDQPLLGPDEWETALRAHGFENVYAWPLAGSPARVLGQRVIAAFSGADVPIVAETRRRDQIPADRTSESAWRRSSGGVPSDAVATTPTTFVDRLKTALPEERRETVLAFVRRTVTRVLRLAPGESIGTEVGLMSLGMDSLMALELRSLLGSGLGLPAKDLSATLAFDHPNCRAIADYLLRQVLALEPAVDIVARSRPTVAPSGDRSARGTDVASLSDREVEALLLQKIEQMPVAAHVQATGDPWISRVETGKASGGGDATEKTDRGWTR